MNTPAPSAPTSVHTRDWKAAANSGFVQRAAFSGAALCALALFSAAALAAVAPPLGNATSFAVIGASAVTNTGPSVITGDLGISPSNASSVTGFPPGLVVGSTHFADGVALAAQNDVTAAYNTLAGQSCNSTVSADLGGSTLVSGTYCNGSSMGLTGTLTLDAQGNPNAVFVFQIGSTLTTASNSVVRLINGGQSCNVFWQVGSSATLGTSTTFVGNILALTSIGLLTGASTDGRVIARTGAVTMNGNAVTVCSLASATAPTAAKAFVPPTISAGGTSTLVITVVNPNPAPATLTAPLTDTLPTGMLVASAPNATTTCGGSGTIVAVAGASTVTLPAGRIVPANGSCTMSVDVTAAAGGSLVNALPAGSLVTSNGTSVATSVATLSVIPVGQVTPVLGKAFSPATFVAGATTTLTITLSNPGGVVSTLSSALVDTLPSGMLVAPTPNAFTTCGGSGAPSAVPGASTVSLPAGRTIPANGSCTLSVNVTAVVAGSYVNTLLAGALATNTGSSTSPAIATATAIPVPNFIPTASAIPTLSGAMQSIGALALALLGLIALRRRG